MNNLSTPITLGLTDYWGVLGVQLFAENLFLLTLATWTT